MRGPDPRDPRWRVALVLLLACGRAGSAQHAPAVPPTPPPARHWRGLAAGVATSLLAHEAAHVLTALAVGAHPTFGLDHGRPTVYSGIDAATDPHRQFLFSSMGLNTQAGLDEAILDRPHAGSTPFERGILAGGIATALFYVTIGRTASVSDIDYMARTSSLTKTQLTMLYGGVALLHSVRVTRDGRAADFFLRPVSAIRPAARAGARSGLHVGVTLSHTPPP